MNQRFEQINNISGTLKLPGDKSISHRSVMFASMAEGESRIYNHLDSADVNSTINIFRQLGTGINEKDNCVIVHGKGFKGFDAPLKELDAGNSGTTARLICGILAAQNFASKIKGDFSLSFRPMNRVVEPLMQFGANISCSDQGTLPISILPTDKLFTQEYELNVASAQVKSAVILAALHNEDKSVIIERAVTRNHTENMLGLKVEEHDGFRKIFVSKDNFPIAFEYNVPSDISTASFFIVLTLLLKNSTLRLENVCLNPTRTGLLEVLKKMGAHIEIENVNIQCGEQSGDLVVHSSELRNIKIDKSVIPNIIDEIPILAVAGVFAEGKFRIENAKELRYKESDRISSVCKNLKAAGLNVVEFEDGFEVSGELQIDNVEFDSYGDHRIAMAFSILSMLMKNGGRVKDFDCVSISNPKFLDQLKIIGAY